MALILGVGVGKLRRVERHEPGIKVHDIMIYRVCSHFNITPDEMLYENLRKKM